MENSLVVVLVISAVGMTLLFLALALFYGLMSLLTRVFRDPEPTSEPAPTAKGPPPGDREGMLQAAAIAVALARAEQELWAGEKVSAKREVSPWWAAHHQRQTMLKSTTRKSHHDPCLTTRDENAPPRSPPSERGGKIGLPPASAAQRGDGRGAYFRGS